jgi:hypothetical protein
MRSWRGLLEAVICSVEPLETEETDTEIFERSVICSESERFAAKSKLIKISVIW